MKQMRREELEELITRLYCKCIAHIHETDYVKLSSEEKVSITEESKYIYVEWHLDPISNIEDTISNIEDCIRWFAEEIRKMTFGNLKVTEYVICKIAYIARIYICKN